MLGPTELVVILLLVLLFFGATKVPQLARSLGQGMREFREGASTADPCAPETACGHLTAPRENDGMRVPRGSDPPTRAGRTGPSALRRDEYMAQHGAPGLPVRI
ncbi:MAG: twin-arginine translocase TatA/TatE family subunit [Armatimonadetes bacterium]|nr:twin-arginine translocase TatA/TatE family subunit [Armatimonadota bacterium]PIU91684.1 MAG: hypothetical protein COS65_21175 [Armatimonadetes bacterium CG06_land_8_20_14_3_00_66_21]